VNLAQASAWNVGTYLSDVKCPSGRCVADQKNSIARTFRVTRPARWQTRSSMAANAEDPRRYVHLPGSAA